MGQINDLYNYNKSNPFLCNKKISTWLIKNNMINVLEGIRNNNGIIGSNEIKYIFESDFISSHIHIFNSALSLTPFTITKFENNNLYVKFSNPEKRIISYLYISSQKMMLHFGNYIIENELKISPIDFCKNLELIFCDDNLNLIDKLSSYLKKTDYYVLEADERQYLARSSNKCFTPLELFTFISKQKENILFFDDTKIAKLIWSINRITKWEPIENIKKYAHDDISKKPSFN